MNGRSLTATPVKDLVPDADRLPSLTLVATVKLPLKFKAGVNVNAASKVLTSATAPLAVQTPVPAFQVEVTAPDVPLFKLPAVAFDSVNVAVTVALSMSLMTISVRFRAVSSV